MPSELACETETVFFEAVSILWNGEAVFSDYLSAAPGAQPELGSGGKCAAGPGSPCLEHHMGWQWKKLVQCEWLLSHKRKKFLPEKQGEESIFDTCYSPVLFTVFHPIKLHKQPAVCLWSCHILG